LCDECYTDSSFTAALNQIQPSAYKRAVTRIRILLQVNVSLFTEDVYGIAVSDEQFVGKVE
jgi:hypothetical protein